MKKGVERSYCVAVTSGNPGVETLSYNNFIIEIILPNSK